MPFQICSISLPRFWKNLPRSWKNLPRFWKNLPRFRKNLPRFRKNLPRFFVEHLEEIATFVLSISIAPRLSQSVIRPGTDFIGLLSR